MTPMIDVIFLLLVFFIATSSFQVVEKLLPGSVSESSSAAGQQNMPPPEVMEEMLNQVVVRLQKENGRVFVELNGQRLADFRELQQRFASIAQVDIGLPVIIDPDHSVTAEWVIKAYDWARVAGLIQVYMAIGRSENPEPQA